MASNRVTAFFDQLRASQLLTPAQVNEAQRHPLAGNDDPFLHGSSSHDTVTSDGLSRTVS